MGDHVGTLLYYVGLSLWGFFVCTPMLFNAISEFTVQKKFNRLMVEKEIISLDVVKPMERSKQIIGIVIVLIVIGAAIKPMLASAPIGVYCLVLSMVVSILKFRVLLQYNNKTVEKFKNTYKEQYDVEKYNAFVEENF